MTPTVDELAMHVAELAEQPGIGVQLAVFVGSHFSHWKLVGDWLQVALSATDVPTAGNRGVALSAHCGGVGLPPPGGGLPPPGVVHTTVTLAGSAGPWALAAYSVYVTGPAVAWVAVHVPCCVLKQPVHR